MTLVYTPYTLLEDAWGSNFDNDHKKKKSKKSSKKSSDPLCELYNKRYKKIRKPFYNKDSDMLENEYFHQVHSFKGGKDNNMYFGYKDDDFTRLANAERQQTNTLMIDENGHCIDTYNSADKLNNSPSSKKKKQKAKPKKKKVTFNIEPEDEDDMYLQQAVLNEEQEEENIDEDEYLDMIPSESFEDIVDTQQNSFDRIYSNVYEETDDELELEEEASPKRKERVCEENTISEKSISELIEDEIRKNSYLKSLHRDHHATFVDERQYLDLLMYMFSGIILIFILEQFIQIGIKMKTPIY